MIHKIPPVEERIRIVSWLLSWGAKNGKRVWSSREFLRVSDGHYDDAHPLSWSEAKRIADQEEADAIGKSSSTLTGTKTPHRPGLKLRERMTREVQYQEGKKWQSSAR